MYSLPPKHAYNYQHLPLGTFVTLDEPMQTCQYHPESLVYTRVILGIIHSVGFDKLL